MIFDSAKFIHLSIVNLSKRSGLHICDLFSVRIFFRCLAGDLFLYTGDTATMLDGKTFIVIECLGLTT